MFCTFLIVIRGCTTDEELANRWKGPNLCTSLFKSLIHVLFAVGLVSVFFMPSCDKSVYPWNFMYLSVLILSIQLFCFYLWRSTYNLNYATMPKISWNRLKYNKFLTMRQLKVLQITFFVFGFLTLFLVVMGSILVR